MLFLKTEIIYTLNIFFILVSFDFLKIEIKISSASAFIPKPPGVIVNIPFFKHFPKIIGNVIEFNNF